MESTQESLPETTWEDVPAIVRRFAQAWLSGRRPGLRRFLGQSKGHPRLADLAFTLARTDLNQRLLAGDDPPLEELLRVLEQQGVQLDEARRLRLVRLEYDRRWWRGEPGVSRAEYQQRFLEHSAAIAGWTPLWTCPACKREEIPLPDKFLPGLEESPESAADVTVDCPTCKSGHRVADLFRVPTEQGFDRRDYALGDCLGVGGMGAVYKSHDPGLKREVAIKVIGTKYHGNRGGEWRFVQEAKIASRLAHPHIVPVYNIGRLANSRLFYTMQLVDGRALTDKIALLSDQNASARERVEACLEDFERVCQAVAYAHQQGVIHRDLKPGNIKVGDSPGKVQVLDWGLVKRLTVAEEKPTATMGEEASPSSLLADLSAAPHELQTRGLHGTPLYAAPEQFQTGGEGAVPVGKAVDVFALGALLCEILTGLPPYVQAKEDLQNVALLDTIKRMVTGDALWPGIGRLAGLQANPKFSPHHALVQLAEECLARDLAARPTDAGAVARRVADYQAATRQRAEDARIAAAKLGEEKKKKRFARLLALSLSVFFVAAAIAAVAFKVQAKQKADLAEQEKTARLKADEQRMRALNYGGLARSAIQEFTVKISRDPRLHEHELQALRKRLLQSAQNYYQQLIEIEPTDDESRLLRGQAYQQIATLLNELGERAEAEKHWLRAIEDQETLHKQLPAIPDYASDLAASYNELSMVYLQSQQVKQSESLSRSALGLWQELDQKFPRTPRYRLGIALGHMNLGLILMAAEKWQEAMTALNESVRIFESTDVEEDSPRHQQLATLYTNIGALLAKARNSVESEHALKKALDLWGPADRGEEPIGDRQLLFLARCHHNYAIVLERTGRYDLAEKSLQRALEILGKLARAHPSFVEYRADQARTTLLLGKLYQSLERDTDAEKCLEEAQTALKKLAADFPAHPEFHADFSSAAGHLLQLLNTSHRLDKALALAQDLRAYWHEQWQRNPTAELADQVAGSLLNLGNIQQEAQQYAEAKKNFDKADQIWTELATKDATNPAYQADLARVHFNRGNLFTFTLKFEEAEAEYKQALEVRKQLAQNDPEEASTDLVLSYQQLGILLRLRGKGKEAAEQYRLALAVLDPLVKAFPNKTKLQAQQAICWMNLGMIADEQERPADRELPFREAVRIQKQVLAHNPTSARERFWLATMCNHLATPHEKTNRADEEAITDEALKILEALCREQPENLEYKAALGTAYANRGILASTVDPVAGSLYPLTRAVETLEEVLKSKPAGLQTSISLSRALQARSVVLIQLSLALNAAKDIDRMLSLEKVKDPQPLLEVQQTLFKQLSDYERARFWAVHAVVRSRARSLSDTEQAARVEEGVTKALESLEIADSVDYFAKPKAVKEFTQEPDFAVLRARAAFQRLSGRIHHALGEALAAARQQESAVEAYQTAIEQRRQVLRQPAPTTADRRALADSNYNLANTHIQQRQWDRAERAYRRTIELQEELLNVDKANPARTHFELAMSRTNLGVVYIDTMKFPEAKETLLAASSDFRKALHEAPDKESYLDNQFVCYLNLGNLHQLTNNGRDSEQAYLEAEKIQEALTKRFPNKVRYQGKLAAVQSNLAQLYDTQGQTELAQKYFDKALTAVEPLARPSHATDYRDQLAALRNSRAIWLHSQGQHDEAQAEHEKVLTLRKQLAQQFPKETGYRIDLGGGYCNLGILVEARGKAEQALPWFQQAINELEPVVASRNDDRKACEYLRNSYYNRANTLFDLKRYYEALADLEQAIPLAKDSPHDTARLLRAHVFAALGDHARAVRELDEFTKGKEAPEVLLRAARVLAVASAAAAKDVRLTQEQRRSLKDKYARKAIAVLKKLLESGHTAAEQLQKQPDFDALRQQPAYQELLTKPGPKNP